ncbi:hypothetical protein SS50377_25755 [Spironucleus salmonicida]|uniref:Uncharacterized protein n=1 Tax=Spironucleus salmonicida TaxID=348837 RepID=V6LVK1_9EUKA|nr:hypothetical protein SS50377_25755 [Spironucleus salmonicida]|eukprot:EST48268.1 Hypothetical protein SS50377_11609 [Spironucleus salmonicida]
MSMKSILHIFPPQPSHLKQSSSQAYHNVCMQITDYCTKTANLSLSTPLFKLPAFSTIPQTNDRFVFDEILCEPQLFADIHSPNTPQTLQPNPIQNSIDKIASKIVSQAHHGTCKLIINYGSACSGHGILAFGTYPQNDPQIGLVWSILDALSDCEIRCFSLENGGKIRDLLDDTQLGTVLKPKTQFNLITPETLNVDLCGLQNTTSGRLKLANSLHQKRRILAKYQRFDRVVDRSSDEQFPILQKIHSQLGPQNHNLALDLTPTTFVLLSPKNRQNSQILLIDFPACCANSGLQGYTLSPRMHENLKIPVELKSCFRSGANSRNGVISRVLGGCVPGISDGEVVQICSVQLSDFERVSSGQILRMAGMFDKNVVERFFDGFVAEKNRKRVESSFSNQQIQQQEKQFTFNFDQIENFDQDENSIIGKHGFDFKDATNRSIGYSNDETEIVEKIDIQSLMTAKELLKDESNDDVSDGDDWATNLFRSSEWQVETQGILKKMKMFLDSIQI